MNRPLLTILIILFLSSSALLAQRRITPVPVTPGTQGTPEKKEDSFNRRNVISQTDAEGNIIYIDTISGLEVPDTTIITKVKKMEYPLLNSLNFGVDIWDPVMRMLGQRYGLASVWAEINLHNRYLPVMEFGFGQANDTPDGMNFTYRSKLAPFFKLGANYNVFYNSNPAYQLNVGVRYGFSPFRYSITNVTVDEGYWGDPATFNIPSQSATVGFFELVAGVKVKIFGPISMGWMVRYHAILHESKNTYGKPMYIPGYGKRGSSITGSFSVIYTLPLNRKKVETVINDEQQ